MSSIACAKFTSELVGPATPPSENDDSAGNSTTLSDALITGTPAVAPFYLSSDGSTSSVTTNAAGQLVGTKDTQAWQTRGMPANNLASTSDELAALLASFAAKDGANGAVAVANTAAAKSDISAWSAFPLGLCG